MFNSAKFIGGFLGSLLLVSPLLAEPLQYKLGALPQTRKSLVGISALDQMAATYLRLKEPSSKERNSIKPSALTAMENLERPLDGGPF